MKKGSAFLAAILGAVMCFGCGKPNSETPPDKEPEGDKWAVEFVSVFEGEEKQIASGGKCVYEPGADLGDKNYLKMIVSSNVTLRGEIRYAYEYKGDITDDSDEDVETFYTLAGQNVELRQILDFYGENEGNKKLRSIELFNLGDTDGKITLSNVSAAKHPIDFYDVSFTNKEVEPQMQLFVAGETVKIGCTLKSGGAVNWLSSTDGTVRQINTENGVYVGKEQKSGAVVADNDVNLVNSHDNGRLIQQSYYGIGPDNNQGYIPGEFGADDNNTRPWHYNPVQGGDKKNFFSRLVDVQVSEGEVYIKARPMDWAKVNEVTPSYMENWYSVEKDPELGEYVKVRNRFTDFSGYEHNNPRAQELPAFYGIAPLGKAVYYNGDKPFTNDELTYCENMAFWDGNRDARIRCTENWIAWVNEDDWGVGLYVPDVVTTLAGRTTGFNNSVAELGSAPYKAATSTYAAPLGNFSMETYKAFDYTYYLALNSVSGVRELFAKLKEGGAKNEFLVGKEVPNWV